MLDADRHFDHIPGGKQPRLLAALAVPALARYTQQYLSAAFVGKVRVPMIATPRRKRYVCKKGFPSKAVVNGFRYEFPLKYSEYASFGNPIPKIFCFSNC